MKMFALSHARIIIAQRKLKQVNVALVGYIYSSTYCLVV